MKAIPVIAIFDVGKTNKKIFLFDESYKIVWERSQQISEIVDDDGFPCENLSKVCLFLFNSLKEINLHGLFKIIAINFSTYGASLVYLNEKGDPLAFLYNYLKPYPEELKQIFYENYGSKNEFSYKTASPVLGNLNSGLQLYRIKMQKKDLFSQVHTALHFPQYMSFLLTNKCFSEMTSIGCHTALWDFSKNDYHYWVYNEGIYEKLAPVRPSDHVETIHRIEGNIIVGIGLHDSSAALIPYLIAFQEPFALISTGTWCITLNPFNHSSLTMKELENDCLCYLSYQGNPVKASRLFAGKEHEDQTKKIADHFNLNPNWYQKLEFDFELIVRLQEKMKENHTIESKNILESAQFVSRNLNSFSSATEAYHQLMLDIMKQQYVSTQLVITGSNIKRIFVDGGFSNNGIYMTLLAAAFPHLQVFAASIPQATAIGAALAIHKHWNSNKSIPTNFIELKLYSIPHNLSL